MALYRVGDRVIIPSHRSPVNRKTTGTVVVADCQTENPYCTVLMDAPGAGYGWGENYSHWNVATIYLTLINQKEYEMD